MPLAFLLVAAAMLWPLPTRLMSALPGDPAGDTGVYIWNLWIFRHEFLDHARLPLSTGHIFAFSGDADFSLHNYTPLAGMLGMPLMPWLGVVGTFNVVMMIVVAGSGWATYVLGRRAGLSSTAAFAAGSLFIATPTLVAREMAHLSLVSAAALPLFQWALFRALDSGSRRDAILVGIMVAFASYSDAYFGIYCVVMGLFTVGWQFTRLSVERTDPHAALARRVRALHLVLIAITVAAAAAVSVGMEALEIAGAEVRLGLHGPVLLTSVVTLVRLGMTRRTRLHLHDPEERLPALMWRGALACGVCLVLLLPPVIGIADRLMSGRLPETHVFWRSSPRGVDLLAYLSPNPLNPFFGSVTKSWLLPPQEDAFPEFVAGFSLVAVALLVWAWGRDALPRFWIGFTALFASLSLGPFIHVGGVNTLVPGPWALLRYLPILGMARAPSRFAIVAVLGGSILFGFAVDVLRCRASIRWVALLFLVLAFELNPVPRTLWAADVPSVYRLIATGDESMAVLELPTGVRDGTSSIGNFTAATQYFQTAHHRRLVGGYLSRVSEWRKREMWASPTLRSLLVLSTAGAQLAPEDRAAAVGDRDRFLARSCVGYVVLNKQASPPGLRAAAASILRLESLHEDEHFELLRPREPPACQRPVRQRFRRMRQWLRAADR